MEIKYPEDFNPGNVKIDFTPSSSVWINDEIIFIFSHPDINHTLEHAKISNKILDVKIPDISYPMICDVRDAKPLSKEVRNYYASKEGTKHCTKFAFIVSSSFSRVVANFFIGFATLKYPIKMFENPKEAIQWCKNK
jgi:hypothetical protein